MDVHFKGCLNIDLVMHSACEGVKSLSSNLNNLSREV